MLQSTTLELEARNVSLADAMRTKDRFVATMSHELRTPLNAVLSYADILDLGISGPLNENQRSHLGRITASARHLLELIGGVLDFAKLNAGQLGVDCRKLDLMAEVREAIDMVDSQAATKHFTLTIHQPPVPLGQVLGDRLRVRQILLNLLSNAIKFTDQGEVTVRFQTRENAASVVVADTGIGIAAEKLAPLFRDFYQADDGLTRSQDGSGLGLAISKRLALLMGGDLTAASELGRGSEFTFTLPLAAKAPFEFATGTSRTRQLSSGGTQS